MLESTASTPTTCPSAIAGTAIRLSAPASPGTGISWPGPISPDSSNDRRIDRDVLRHLPEAPDPDRAGPGRGDADHAFAEGHLGADALGLVAVAGDREQPRPVLVEQQEQRVLVAEQLGQAVDGDAHQGVEVAAPADAGAQLRRGPVGSGSRRTRSG